VVGVFVLESFLGRGVFLMKCTSEYFLVLLAASLM